MKSIIAFMLALAFLLPPAAGAVAAEQKRAFPVIASAADLQAKYVAAGQGGEKVKVLLMPGHEPTYGGAELAGLRERDIAVNVANKIARELSLDSRLEVTVARDQLSWNADLSGYFEKGWRGIQKFVKEKKRVFNRALKRGDIKARDFEPAHNTAATDVALRLYGITKWANEEGYDLAVHLHLNDTGAQNHQGFAVYVPDTEFGNAEASRPLGEAIAYELNRFNASSTLPIENYGVVEDQSLIALGAFNTAAFPSVLVEYAYIYEPKIKNPEARDAVLSDMAHQTYRGIEKALGASVTGSNTLVLPFAWTGTTKEGISSPEAYALQVALKSLGFFPPNGQLLIGCPMSGVMDACTISALNAFQASKGWTPTGAIGPMTKAALKAAGF